jgi:hypothetical protein
MLPLVASPSKQGLSMSLTPLNQILNPKPSRLADLSIQRLGAPRF